MSPFWCGALDCTEKRLKDAVNVKEVGTSVEKVKKYLNKYKE